MPNPAGLPGASQIPQLLVNTHRMATAGRHRLSQKLHDVQARHPVRGLRLFHQSKSLTIDQLSSTLKVSLYLLSVHHLLSFLLLSNHSSGGRVVRI